MKYIKYFIDNYLSNVGEDLKDTLTFIVLLSIIYILLICLLYIIAGFIGLATGILIYWITICVIGYIIGKEIK